jgi:hypothetical protein
MRRADIELTDKEHELIAKISFDWETHDELRASIEPMTALSEALLRRGAIPGARRLYFTDPERNPGGRGKSRQDVFEKNGTVGEEILRHPNFLKYLEYFIYGPDLPPDIVRKFKDAAREGHLSHNDVLELVPAARRVVREHNLKPYEASEEFYKLALECGAMPSSADSVRRAIKAIRVR